MVATGTRSTEHPHIVRTPGTCGGRARIDGTRITVWLVVTWVVRAALSPEEFVEQYPGVTLAQVHDALSFYYDHQDEIHRDLRDQGLAWRAKKPRKLR